MTRSLICALVAIVPAMMEAQTTTATIQGDVHDPSGAAISGATVAVTNQNNGTSNQVVTNAQGVYFVPFLQPGQYTVTAKFAGFSSFTQTGIRLDVQQVLALDIAMTVGDVSSTVAVSGTAQALDTASSDFTTTMENKLVDDLPLNGRVALQLSELTPGVIPGHGAAGSSIGVVTAVYVTAYAPWVAGSRNSTSDVLMDGVSLSVPNTQPTTVQLGITGPTVDAVQEFTILTNALPAEYGRTGGGVVNVASKTGTNQFHGDAYEFFRNSDFDAKNFFTNSNGLRQGTFQRNQFGGTIGGPVDVPRVYNGKNRTFFFFDMESTDARVPDSYTTTVPLDAWKQGNFAGLLTSSGAPVTINDPSALTANANGTYTRAPFPGNQIPTSRFDPVAANLLKFFPEPNATSTNPYTPVNNWTQLGKDSADQLNFGVRIDHNFTDKWRTFGRFTQSTQMISPNDFFGQADPVGRGVFHFAAHAFVWDNTYVLNSTTVFNVRYGLSRFALTDDPLSTGFLPTELGFPSYLNTQAAFNELRFPRFNITSLSSLGQQNPGGQLEDPTTHNIVASVTKVVGQHSIKMGFDYRKLFMNSWNAGYPDGDFSFDSTWTQQNPLAGSSTQGFGMGSLLLGLPTTGTQNNTYVGAWASSYFAGYIQDDWRVTKRLTLNLGLRYDVDTPRTERYNRQSYFEIGAPSPIAGMVPGFPNLTGAMEFTTPSHRQLTSAELTNFSPRFGFAYKINNSTVLRGGYALMYAPSPVAAAQQIGTEGFNSSTSQIVSLDSVHAVNTLSNPFPYGFNQVLGSTPGPTSGANTDLGLGVGNSWFPSNKSPEIQQWNVTLQRSLPWDSSVELAYVANKGNDLAVGEALNYDQLPDSDLALGTKLTSLVPNPFYGVITNPNSVLSSATVQMKYLLGPYPQYSSVTPSNPPFGNSNYQSFTARAEKRFSNSLGFLVSYAGGKLIDDSSFAGTLTALGAASAIQDLYNRRLDRSVSVDDVSSRLVASITAALPVGKGQRFLNGASTPVNAILGGWQVNCIYTFSTGTPIAISQAVNQIGLGNPSQRPNETGNPDSLATSEAQRITGWFNTAAFTLAAPYTYGTTPRTLPNIRQPGIDNADASIFKSFRPIERALLTFRFEVFNSLNHTQLGQAASVLGNSNFGTIAATGVDNRELQFALKLQF
ncbi:MAG TPA: TonB-dependent receptor [Bryobacteraceae bacterium]|jgi:hypothetical protein|nr:TonB-dependent receptor [Bryobacteraceae bacterium]